MSQKQCSSTVEHLTDNENVTGSIPVIDQPKTLANDFESAAGLVNTMGAIPTRKAENSTMKVAKFFTRKLSVERSNISANPIWVCLNERSVRGAVTALFQHRRLQLGGVF